MMSNTPLNADELDNFMRELGFLWDSYQSVWRNDGRKQYDRDYDDSISMDLAKQLLADRKKHELQAYSDGFQKASKGAFKSQQAAKREAVEEVLDRLQPLVADNPKNRHKTTHRQYLVLEAIEAERNKLKEVEV